MLEALGVEAGIAVRCVGLVSDDAGPVGSRRIRQALAEGNVAVAAHLLGRPHEVEGVVVHGQARGRTTGFPTANVDVGDASKVQLPSDGVYVARVSAAPLGPGDFLAVVNLGHRPTLRDGLGRSLEAHILDVDVDLYGHPLRVAFEARLRGEQRFSGLDALCAAIARDCEAARAHAEGGSRRA